MPIKEISYNKFFNLLYSLNNIEIDEVNNLLDKYQYGALMEKYYQNLNLNFDTVLTEKDIQL